MHDLCRGFGRLDEPIPDTTFIATIPLRAGLPLTGLTEIIRQASTRVCEERIRSHIAALEGPRHPLSSPQALESAAAYIRETLGNLGHEMSEHDFEDDGGEFRNIIATLRGSDLADEHVLVVAHYDTVAGSPGADDNASGVALLLELAWMLRQFSFRRSIRFIGVNLEENGGQGGKGEGRRGSRALASFARENGWDLAGVVVLESVAYAGESIAQSAPAGLPIEVPKTGDFIAVVGNHDSMAMVGHFADCIERFDIALPYQQLVVPGKGEMLPDSRRSDHASFWDEGFRAIMVTDTTNFRSPHYHLASDTLDTLNIPFAAQVCGAVGVLVAEMAIPVPAA